MWRSGYIDSRVLDLKVVSITPQSLYPWGNSHWYQMESWLGDRMIMDNNLEKVWEKITVTCFSGLFHHMSGGLRKNRKNFSKNNSW
jgi:hypothetical protein